MNGIRCEQTQIDKVWIVEDMLSKQILGGALAVSWPWHCMTTVESLVDYFAKLEADGWDTYITQTQGGLVMLVASHLDRGSDGLTYETIIRGWNGLVERLDYYPKPPPGWGGPQIEPPQLRL